MSSPHLYLMSSNTYTTIIYVPKNKSHTPPHHHQYYINLHFTSCHFSEGFTFVQTMASISQQDSMKALKTVCLHFDDTEKKALKHKLDETSQKFNDQTNAVKELVSCSARLNREHKQVRAAVHHNACMLLASVSASLLASEPCMHSSSQETRFCGALQDAYTFVFGAPCKAPIVT